MSANPIPDPSQQPITAADPRVAQILAMIQAKNAPANPTAPNYPDPSQLGPVASPPPQVAPVETPATGMVAPVASPVAPQPTVEAAPKPGPIKSFLQHLVSGLGTATYAGSQAALQHLGMPTDYSKQQDALKIGLQQQQADALTGLRTAQSSAAQAKADQLDAMNQPFVVPNDPSIPASLRGQTITQGSWQALSKVFGQNQGKTDAATIGATAKTDVADTQASSRERLANAQLEVRQAIADRNYGLAAKRLSLAGGNQNLRQLEYRMRAYGTGADGQPLPGVEFTADGTPVGTATQTNVRPTVNARNAGERADTMQDLATRIRGALNDPEIRAGLGPVAGRINDVKGHAGVLDGPLAELRNDLVSYGAFQAGLHPVRGIGGLQYFEKVMGGLGQTPEQLLAKLSSNDATARSVQHVAKGGGAGGVQALTDGGVTYHIPAALVPAFKKDHPSAR